MASFTLNYLFKTPNSKYRSSGLGLQHASVRAGDTARTVSLMMPLAQARVHSSQPRLVYSNSVPL